MQYKFLMALSRFLCLLPHGALLAMGKVLGKLYYLLIKKQRNLAIMQMQRSLGLPDAETRRLVKESFVSMAQNVLEILWMPHLNQKNFRDYIEIEHLERLKDALDEGHGVVILTGHIGTWEWLSAALVLSGLPITAIAKPQPNEQYTHALDTLRASYGAEIFSRGTSELIAAARALKKGKALGFLADQDGGPGGAFVEFFGKIAATPMGPAVFARKFNSPVVPCFILRRLDGRHRVVVHEAMRYEDTGDTDRDLYAFTVRMTQLVEQVIRENPTQWLWFQHRWNTPPEEQKIHHHTVKAEGEKQ